MRPDGAVKVLDFGLAKAMDSSAALKTQERARADSPTITSPAMTQMGMILGTAAYMAPEQARGKVLDRRADIWAFGALLFEMLTGRRAFEGDDLAVTLAAVMMKEPDWSRLPSATPPRVQRLMRRCLVKDPRQRIRDMGDVRLAFEATFEEESSVAAGAQPLPSPASATRAARTRRLAAFVAVAIGAAAVAGAGVWVTTRPLAPRVSRTTITGSGPTALAVTRSGGHLAITPDGSRVVYVGNNATQLFVRALDALEPTALVSGGSLAHPFISPDGQWVGFFDNNTSLKKVAISGGPAYAVATLDGGAIRGGTWLSDDTIVVATGTVPLGLQSVPANGGAPTELTTVDTARGESDHVFPEALPGRRAVLFTITSLTGGSRARSIAVYDLDTHTQTILVRGGSLAKFMPSGSSSSMRAGRPGHLVYVEAEYAPRSVQAALAWCRTSSSCSISTRS